MPSSQPSMPPPTHCSIVPPYLLEALASSDDPQLAAQAQATLDVDSGRIVVVSALDNLGKGAAGQAVQCANLMFGLPETAGLSAFGVAP